MQTQNFKNHSQLVPLFHYVTLPAILALIIGSFINLSNAVGKGEGIYSASLICLIAIILFFLAFLARGFGLKAQDRAIRAEENFRHFIATGKPMDSRLKISQVIALRFASDAEFIALSKKAIDENLNAKAIKQAIKDWRGDYYRV